MSLPYPGSNRQGQIKVSGCQDPFYKKGPDILTPLLSLVCLSLDALFDLGWRWWHVSPGGYERVMMGMTEREVVAVLGQPGGFEGYGDFLYPASTLSEYDRMWFRPMNGGWIVVMFNGNNRVVGRVLHFPGLNEQHFVAGPEG
jgi:hypothetical protein